MISIIIPIYNEAETITACLQSLIKQSTKDFELILIDDGSTDESLSIIKNLVLKTHVNSIKIFYQKHQGPGAARNSGVKKSKGEILIFVDADMVFDRDYIKSLTNPIILGIAKGTFTKEEYVFNWGNVWARCWNYNEGIYKNRRHPDNYPNQCPVFRAILSSEFNKAGGFDEKIGFTDDWSLSRKLGYQATCVSGAVCYHNNPGKFKDVYQQARWIGKNEFISGTLFRKVLNLIRFNPLIQFIRSIFISVIKIEPHYILFSLVYYSGICISIIKSFIGEDKYK